MLFVTGVNGVAGRAAVARASELGLPVCSIARSDRLGLADKIQLTIGDLKRLLPRFSTQVDGIIHLAASRNNTLQDDVLGDLGILAELLRHWKGHNFVFASSQIVYSESPSGSPTALNESSPCDPINWYAAAKLMSETLIRAHHHQNFPDDVKGRYVILRVPLVLSASPSETEQGLENYARLVRSNHDFYWDCDEEIARGYGTSWIGDRDLANCLLKALELPDSAVFNVQSGFLCWLDFIEQLIALSGSKSRIHFGSKRGTRMPHSVIRLNCEAWNSQGFQPQDSWTEIVSSTFESRSFPLAQWT